MIPSTPAHAEIQNLGKYKFRENSSPDYHSGPQAFGMVVNKILLINFCSLGTNVLFSISIQTGRLRLSRENYDGDWIVVGEFIGRNRDPENWQSSRRIL